MENQELLVIKNLTKVFPGVVAVDNVSFSIRRGEVHVLIGENGAGKSTLVKMIAGIYKTDAGEMILDGKVYQPQNVLDAQKCGVNIVHQELSMMPNRTVAQNIFIGREPIKGKVIKSVDIEKMNAESQALLNGLGIKVDVREITKNLSIALQQMVEVAKATSTENKLLILDEPTSSLTAPEIKALFTIVKQLKEKGVSIIYISHRMNEIFEIGDRITVMRDGKYVGTREISSTSIEDVISMMIGRVLGKCITEILINPAKQFLKPKDLQG